MHVDGAFAALLNPDKFCKKLQSDLWNCNLENVEESEHHFGGDFFHDKDGTFCCGAHACMKCLCDDFKMTFGAPPMEAHAPVNKDDKPEFDDSVQL